MPVRRSASHWGAFSSDVVDGKIQRIIPFEHDPRPSPLLDAWAEMIDSGLRVASPAARRGWLAGDGGAGRGDDDFVEISWDEALDRAARDIARIRDGHGHRSLFAGSYGWSSAGRIHHARTLIRRFYGTLGGFTDQVTNYSYGAAMAFLPRVVGVKTAVGASLTSYRTLASDCDVFLAFGGLAAKNWEVNSGGFGLHGYDDFMAAVTARARVVNISPYRDDVENRYPSEWLAVRPNTDTALMLALAQGLVSRQAHDREFLARHCHGAEQFLDYLAGRTDGVEKSSAWAAAITGLPAHAIDALVESLPGKRVMVSATWSLQRSRHGEQSYWAAIALAAVLGQIGLPGGGFGFGYGSANGMGMPAYNPPVHGLPVGPNEKGLSIPVARVADVILDPGGTTRFDGETIVHPDIRLIHWAGGNPFHHHQDLNRLREAFRRPQTVIVNECFWTATARHADLVLPATTPLERDDIGGASRDPFILAMQKTIEPHARARDDYDIFAALAERLGNADAFTQGRTSRDWLRWSWDRTAADLAARGIEAPTFEAFWSTGHFQVPEPPEPFVAFSSFRNDPEGSPLPTPSGRIELCSDTISALSGGRLPGHPAWLDPEEWLGAPGAERWPLHLLTPQPARRLHGQMDWSSHSRAGKQDDRERLTIHPDDAAARGIRDGDFVRIFNDRGECLAAAALDDGVRPGVVLLPTGSTYDPDGRGDRGSNPNVLTRDIGTSELGQGCAAQSCLVEVKRFEGPLPDLRTMRPPVIEPLAQGTDA
jgi:biotin/methionine sulfoxide reductase